MVQSSLEHHVDGLDIQTLRPGTVLVVETENGEDRMTLRVAEACDASALEATLREVTKVRGGVARVDTLPNDGKVIADERRYG